MREAIERTEHLISLVPENCLDWHPEGRAENFSDIGHLLGHLLLCLGGFCSVMLRAFPIQLEHLADLQSLEVNHSCPPEEAIARLRSYSAYMEEGFLCCRDVDLTRVIPTIFVPQGEALLSLLLNNLEHLINHKYQRFIYLKLLGIPVDSREISTGFMNFRRETANECRTLKKRISTL